MQEILTCQDQLILLYLDLDQFKEINDNYGHEMGDIFLCHIADILRREFDNGEIIARFGGDEFLIVIE